MIFCTLVFAASEAGISADPVKERMRDWMKEGMVGDCLCIREDVGCLFNFGRVGIAV